MLTYIFDFNLNVTGKDADAYFSKAVQQWPPLFEELPGVHGCMFLLNAFTLAGKYTYRFRVDMESFASLAAYDEALKSDDQRWREVKSEWLATRSEVQGRLLSSPDDGGRGAGLREGKGLLHTVLSVKRDTPAETHAEARAAFSRRLTDELKSFAGIERASHFSSVFKPAGVGGEDEVWLRIGDLSALDNLDTVSGRVADLVSGQIVGSALFGEVALVEGALRSGA